MDFRVWDKLSLCLQNGNCDREDLILVKPKFHFRSTFKHSASPTWCRNPWMWKKRVTILPCRQQNCIGYKFHMPYLRDTQPPSRRTYFLSPSWTICNLWRNMITSLEKFCNLWDECTTRKCFCGDNYQEILQMPEHEMWCGLDFIFSYSFIVSMKVFRNGNVWGENSIF